MLSEPDWDGSQWAKTQAAVLAAQANRARFQAKRQAAQGVHPAVAARQAAQWTQWSTLFWLFIGVPTIFITVGCWTAYVGVMVWKFAVMGLAYVLLVRLENYKKLPADRILGYKVSTTALVVLGGCLMASGPIVWAINDAIYTAIFH